MCVWGGGGGWEGGRAENGHISVQVQCSAVTVPSRLDGFSLSCAVAAAGAAMRAVLWDLLLLCLFARARGDCRGDCLRCDRHLYRDSFDVLVSPFCLLDCPPPRAAPMGVAPMGAAPTASPRTGWAPSSLHQGWGLGSGLGGGFGCWSAWSLKGKMSLAITVPPPWAPPRDTIERGGPEGGCRPQISCWE